MREIRFRVKKHTGEWITGGFVQKRGVPHIVAHIVDRGVDEWRAIPVIPATVGQFTGLRDSTEREVYEGDILSDARGRLYVIVWRAGGACVYSADEYRDMRRKVPVTLHDALADRQVSNYVQEGLTVVGNIHDDAELLTPKDN